MRRHQIVFAALAAWLIGTTPAALAQDVPGITKDGIKIGVFGPLTGSASVFGKAVYGMEAIYRDLNDRGGIHGRKIEIVREDTACDPAKGLAAVKKLISQDGVFALNGGSCTAVVMAVKPEIGKTDIPFMVSGATGAGVSRPLVANVFQPVATSEVVARTLVDFAMAGSKSTKVAFISPSDEWGKANHDPAVEYLRAKYGVEPVLDLSMEKGASDATPQILRIRQSGAQVVFALMYPAEVAIFLRDAYKYGLKLPVLGPQSVSLEDTRDRVGNPAAVENLYVYYPYAHTFDSPELQKWTALIHKYFPNEKVENFSFLGMGGTLALIAALEKVGPQPTRAKLVAELDRIRDFDTGILATPLSFTPEDHAGIKGGAMARLRGNKPIIAKTWAE